MAHDHDQPPLLALPRSGSSDDDPGMVGSRRRGCWLPGGLVAYLASPVDLVPDFIPVVGQLDDALLLAVVLPSSCGPAGPTDCARTGRALRAHSQCCSGSSVSAPGAHTPATARALQNPQQALS